MILYETNYENEWRCSINIEFNVNTGRCVFVVSSPDGGAKFKSFAKACDYFWKLTGDYTVKTALTKIKD